MNHKYDDTKQPYWLQNTQSVTRNNSGAYLCEWTSRSFLAQCDHTNCMNATHSGKCFLCYLCNVIINMFKSQSTVLPRMVNHGKSAYATGSFTCIAEHWQSQQSHSSALRDERMLTRSQARNGTALPGNRKCQLSRSPHAPPRSHWAELPVLKTAARLIRKLPSVLQPNHIYSARLSRPGPNNETDLRHDRDVNNKFIYDSNHWNRNQTVIILISDVTSKEKMWKYWQNDSVLSVPGWCSNFRFAGNVRYWNHDHLEWNLAKTWNPINAEECYVESLTSNTLSTSAATEKVQSC